MPEQLSFASLFEQAANEERTKHLPHQMEEGIVFYRGIIERFNRALLAADIPTAEKLVEESFDLADKLNGNDPAIFADVHSSGNVLERETAAAPGVIPLWGQTGRFIVEPRQGLRVLIEMEGVLGIPQDSIPTFGAHAVDWAKPFISETGYRSFIGWRFPLVAGMTPATYASALINEFIRRHLKGKLCAIEPRYRERKHEDLPELPRSGPSI